MNELESAVVVEGADADFAVECSDMDAGQAPVAYVEVESIVKIELLFGGDVLPARPDHIEKIIIKDDNPSLAPHKGLNDIAAALSEEVLVPTPQRAFLDPHLLQLGHVIIILEIGDLQEFVKKGSPAGQRFYLYQLPEKIEEDILVLEAVFRVVDFFID